MSIYKHDHNFYINAITGKYFSNSSDLVAAHEFSAEGIGNVMKVYRISTLICVACLPFSIWFGPIAIFVKDSDSFFFINILVSAIGISVLSILFITLAVRKCSTVIDITSSELAIGESKAVYVYFLLFSLNMCILLLSAPRGEGFYVPPTMMPAVALFSFALLLCIYRLVLIYRWPSLSSRPHR